MKIIAVAPSPTTEGSVLPKAPEATINGMPIVTVGDPAVHVKYGSDAVIESIPGITINGKPICTVGATTALGQKVLPSGSVTATVSGASQMGLPDCPRIASLSPTTATAIPAATNWIGQSKKPIPPPDAVEESTIVTLASTYAYDELVFMANDLAEATFVNLLEEVFGKDIGLHAYAELYRDASEGKLKKPAIVVIKNSIVGYAAFHKKRQEIHINEDFIRRAVTDPGTDEQQYHEGLLYAALLEEFGHYLDWQLRHEYSQRGGDAPKDEGAVYGYLMAHIDFFEMSEIVFGTATVDGATTTLRLDLSDVQQQLQQAMQVYSQEMEVDLQTEDYEHFGAGLGDPTHGFYGHYGIEKVLLKDPKKKNDSAKFNEEQLNFTYLGNFLRDYSQLLTKLVMGFDATEREQIVTGFGSPQRAKEVLGAARWWNPIKPTRDTLTHIVEVLAAQETLKHSKNTGLLPPLKELITGEGLKARAAKAGLEIVQLPSTLAWFHQNFTTVDMEMLGVYRPEEHIDNPIGTHVIDTLKDDYLYAPENTKPGINDTFGTKDYIRHIDDHVKIPGMYLKGAGDYANGLPTTATYVKQQLQKVHDTVKGGEPNKALIYFGNALHAIEDYYAHSNFVELALMKVRGDWVFPWVDIESDQLRNFDKATYGNTQNEAHESGRFFVEGYRDVYKDFYRDPAEGEHDFFKHDGFIKTLTKEELKKQFKKFRYLSKTTKYKDRISVSFVEVLDDVVEDTEITEGYPIGKKWSVLYFKADSIQYKIQAVPKSLEVIKSGFFDFETGEYRQVIAKLYIVPDSQSTEVVLHGYASKFKKNYQFIPIVTGLFRGEDAQASISDKIQKMLDAESFTFDDLLSNDGYTIASNGDKEGNKKKKGSKGKNAVLKYALPVSDYCIKLLLEDLAKRQDCEEGRKGVHVGKAASEMLENYNKFITFRKIVLSIIDGYPKPAKYVLDRITDAMKKMGKNIIKIVIQNTLTNDFNALKIEQFRSTLGTDPTHTQIAKDSNTHPFHELAATLAKIAVQDIGSHVHDYIFRKKGDIEDIKQKAVAYLAHPADVDWMDYTVYEWLYKEYDKKPSNFSKALHWTLDFLGIDDDEIEDTDEELHKIVGEEKKKNKYKVYQKKGKIYQKELEKQRQVTSVESHDHDGDDHGEETPEEKAQRIKDQKHIEALEKALADRPEVFIDDMVLSPEIQKLYLELMAKQMAGVEKIENIKRVLKLYEKSKDSIDAFQEDYLSLEGIEEQLENAKIQAVKITKEAFDNFDKILKKE